MVSDNIQINNREFSNIDNLELEVEDFIIDKDFPVLSVADELHLKQINARTGNKYYVDGNRLHELLMVRQNKPEIPVSHELGKMFLDIINGIMEKTNYRDYTDDWREAMMHSATMSLLRYTHKYDPIKGAEIRQIKNAGRKKALKPVDLGKTAFNYISWAATTSIFSTITKLKDRASRRIDNTYDDKVLLAIEDVSDDELNFYNSKGEAIEEEVDLFLDKKQKIVEDANKLYETAKTIAFENYMQNHPNCIRKYNRYIKKNNW